MALIFTSLSNLWCLMCPTGLETSQYSDTIWVLFLIPFNSDKQISSDVSVHIAPLKPTEGSQVFKESWDRYKVTVYSVICCSLFLLLNFLFSMHITHLWMVCPAMQVKKKGITQTLLYEQNAFPCVYSQNQVLPPSLTYFQLKSASKLLYSDWDYVYCGCPWTCLACIHINLTL